MRRTGTAPRLRLLIPLLLLGLMLGLLSSVRTVVTMALPDFQAACIGGEPYAVTACYPGWSETAVRGLYDGNAPSVVLFTDTPRDSPRYTLATSRQVGTVWGLAYRHCEGAVYAAAFHKRQLPLGPGGPGAIYRIDLTSGTVSPFITVPNVGPDRHILVDRGGTDAAAEKWVGRTSLGDLELSADESELYVVNLDDRRIYRFAMPSGTLLGSFDHGAAGEPWADEARPFGLAFHDGYLYHGVVRTAEQSQRRSDLRALVYRSRPDGSQLEQVATVDLTYPRGRLSLKAFRKDNDLRWQPWKDGRQLKDPDVNYVVYPMPQLVDLAFDDRGNLILGLRDRTSDSGLSFPHVVNQDPTDILGFGIGLGDILRGTPNGGWSFHPRREFFDDGIIPFAPETSLGGLAWSPSAGELLVGAYAIDPRNTQTGPAAGVYWYDARSGKKVRHEQVCKAAGLEPYRPGERWSLTVRSAWADNEWGAFSGGVGTVGDVELMCPPAALPTPSASPTVATLTPTAVASPPPSPSRTPTAPAGPTPTAPSARPPQPAHLPLVLKEPPCRPGFQHTDVVLVIDASTSMQELTSAGRSKLNAAREAVRLFLDALDLTGGDQAAIVAFNAEAVLLGPLGADRTALEIALGQIQVARQTRIQRGIAVAHQELLSQRHLPGNNRAMILLTDGRNNPEPVGQAISRAQAAKADGIRLFTIGLGRQAEQAALRQMASRPEDYFFAPDGEELVAIYERIAFVIPCPAYAYWPNGR